MPYDEEYREPYKSACPCGKGFLRRYRVVESNDWEQTREHNTDIEIHCDYCRANYHYEHSSDYTEYLVPNGLSFPKSIPSIPQKYQYTQDETFVSKHSKTVLQEMIADMTAPKHRFIKDLTFSPAIRFADEWKFLYRKRSLPPMVDKLRWYLSHYDELINAYNSKKPQNDLYEEQQSEMQKKEEDVEIQSFRPSFSFDEQQDALDKEKANKEQEEHKYDPFMAQVSYHQTYRADFTGHYWDSCYIESCIDPEFLILNKIGCYPPHITIVKKYQCICTICGKSITALSSDFNILYDEGVYYPGVCCSCHTVSSFEAKAMAILNNYGINYRREVSFDNLNGDSGSPLRFDFALYDQQSQEKYGLLIELQGPHHFKSGYYDEYMEFVEDNSDTAKAKLDKQIEYDRRKAVFCEENQLPLECIKYSSGKDYQALEQRIQSLLRKYKFDEQTINWKSGS